MNRCSLRTSSGRACHITPPRIKSWCKSHSLRRPYGVTSVDWIILWFCYWFICGLYIGLHVGYLRCFFSFSFYIWLIQALQVLSFSLKNLKSFRLVIVSGHLAEKRTRKSKKTVFLYGIPLLFAYYEWICSVVNATHVSKKQKTAEADSDS